MTSGRVIAAIAAIFTAFALVSTASAQYPTPQGSLECTTSVAVKIDGQSKVAATLRDASGNPVAGETVQFSILSGDAELSGSSAVTDANGMAMVTLDAGIDPGNIAISAVYDGLECRAVAQVLGSTFTPPQTGDAGLAGNAGGSNPAGLVLEVLAIVGMGLVSGLLWFRLGATQTSRG